MTHLLIAFVLGLTISAAAAQPTPASDIEQRARLAVEQLAKGEFAAVVASFDEKMRALLPEDKLRAAWATIQSQAGTFRRLGTARVETKGDYRLVMIVGEFEKATGDVLVAFNASNQIVGFSVRPAAASMTFVDAAYVDGKAFSERDVTIDAGGWPLPGTLAVPVGAAPVPAVVLVHGSGPNDRDETIGPNKPFRDLARGLASRGIAVLRYEKRTRQHAAKLGSIPNFTVKEETVDDAVAAVRLLQGTAGIDPRRVFVLGHSLGGTVAPRIAIASPGTRGLIILAGAVRPLEQSIVDQVRYMSLDDGTISPDEQKQLDSLQQLVERVKTAKATDAPIGTANFSAPASYWVDLRGYDPPAAARDLKLPMLVLQGERDYQVTVDDFAKWKTALAARPDVTLKSYPALNHLFIAGSGRSMPTEYTTAGHVAEELIRDIAAWVSAQK